MNYSVNSFHSLKVMLVGFILYKRNPYYLKLASVSLIMDKDEYKGWRDYLCFSFKDSFMIEIFFVNSTEYLILDIDLTDDRGSIIR